MDVLARCLRPIIGWLFPSIKKGSQAESAVAVNLSANMLGLGNAATPSGLTAMEEMAKDTEGGIASDDMCMFLCVNSASIQLIPTTIIALRASYGASSPGAIVPGILFCTGISMAAAVVMAMLMRKRPPKSAPRFSG